MPPTHYPSELASEMDITDEQLDAHSVLDPTDADAKESTHGSEHTLADTRPPCHFFAQNKCKNGNNCSFSHEITEMSNPPPKKPCRNMLTTGVCSWGAACMFDHSMPLPTPQNLPSIVTPPTQLPPICNYFVQGRCNKGQDCTFSHTQPGLVGYMPSATGVPQFGVFIPLQATMVATPAFAPLPQSLVPLPTMPSNQIPSTNPSPFHKTRPCRFYAAGHCGRGNSCSYIHEAQEKTSSRIEQVEPETEDKPLQYDFNGEWSASSWTEDTNANTAEQDPHNLTNHNSEAWEGEQGRGGWEDITPEDWSIEQENDEQVAGRYSPSSDGGWGTPAPEPWDTDIEDLPDQATSLPNKTSDALKKSPETNLGSPNSLDSPSKPEKKPCSWYMRGHCRHGDKCKFSHESSSTDPVQTDKHVPPHLEAKFAKSCRHYLAGRCSRDDCRFSHTLDGKDSVDDNDLADLNTTVEAWRTEIDPITPIDRTPVMSARNIVSSTPPPDADITYESELIHRPKSFERKINNCNVLLTAGCNIQKFDTVYDSATVHISQLPAGTSKAGLEKYIRSAIFGVELKNCEITSVPGKATATFISSADATLAARALNGATMQTRTISASLSTQTGSMSYYPDTTVRITYKPPELHTYVYFPNVETARATFRVDKFKESRPVNFRNYTIQVHYESPGKRMSPAQPWHLVIKGLRLDAEKDREALRGELMELFLPYNATSVHIGQPSYSNDAPKTQILDLLRFKIGSLEDFEILSPVNFMSSERRIVFATFSNRNDATRAVQELDRYSQPKFLDSQVKKNTLRVFSEVLTKNRMPLQKYNAIQSALANLAPSDSKAHIYVTLDDRVVPQDPNIRVLYVSAENATLALELNKKLRSILEGEVWRNAGGNAVWDRAFASDRGLSFFQTLNDSNSSTYVQCDPPRRCVRLFGEEEALHSIRQTLDQLLLRLEPRILPLSASQVDSLLTCGLSKIRQRVGEHVVLDIYGKQMLIPFTFGAGRSGDLDSMVESIIFEAESKKQEQEIGDIRHCMLCTSSEGPLVALGCEHRFHFNCLKEGILASIQIEAAPKQALRCPGNIFIGGPPCDALISTQVIHLLLDEDEQMQLFTAHADRYLQEHRDTFRLCPTPTCPGVYRLERESWWTMRRCPWCWLAFCAACGVRCHDGYTCPSFQNKFASLS